MAKKKTSRIKLSLPTKNQVKQIVKVALWAAASAVIARLIAEVADDPNLFGPLTPAVNIVLVTLKQFFTEGK